MKKVAVNTSVLVALLIGLIGWIALPPLAVLALAVILGVALTVTPTGRQAVEVAMIATAGLRARLGEYAVIVVGVACTVGVLIALQAMGSGFAAMLQSGGRDDTVIVLRDGANSESQSVLVAADVEALEQMPGVARSAAGRPLISPEIVVGASFHERASGEYGYAQLRGLDDAGWVLRPAVHLIAGRRFKPGLREVVVGAAAQGKFKGLDLGASIRIGTTPWRVVGIFASGESFDSELWASRAAVADAYQRGATVSTLTLRLVDARSFPTLSAAVAKLPNSKLDPETTRVFFARQSYGFSNLVHWVSLVVGSIMGAGAILGTLNCLFAAVAARAMDMATLQAVGFSARVIIIAVMLEALLLALLGGLLGAGLAWLAFDGYTTSTLNGLNAVAFRFRVDDHIVWTGLKWALGIGLVGGTYPAVRAARMSVAEALRTA